MGWIQAADVVSRQCVFFCPGEERVRMSSPCTNLSCVTDRLAKWQRQEAAFYWSVWVDHASHCLPQMEKGGRKTGEKDEEMERWSEREEMWRKGGIDRLTWIQWNSQVEGSRKTEMWVSFWSNFGNLLYHGNTSSAAWEIGGETISGFAPVCYASQHLRAEWRFCSAVSTLTCEVGGEEEEEEGRWWRAVISLRGWKWPHCTSVCPLLFFSPLWV